MVKNSDYQSKQITTFIFIQENIQCNSFNPPLMGALRCPIIKYSGLSDRTYTDVCCYE